MGPDPLFFASPEMTCLSGEIRLRKGTPGVNVDAETGLYEGVAYAAQLPWLQHASIRNVSASVLPRLTETIFDDCLRTEHSVRIRIRRGSIRGNDRSLRAEARPRHVRCW